MNGSTLTLSREERWDLRFLGMVYGIAAQYLACDHSRQLDSARSARAPRPARQKPFLWGAPQKSWDAEHMKQSHSCPGWSWEPRGLFLIVWQCTGERGSNKRVSQIPLLVSASLVSRNPISFWICHKGNFLCIVAQSVCLGGGLDFPGLPTPPTFSHHSLLPSFFLFLRLNILY